MDICNYKNIFLYNLYLIILAFYDFKFDPKVDDETTRDEKMNNENTTVQEH